MRRIENLSEQDRKTVVPKISIMQRTFPYEAEATHQLVIANGRSVGVRCAAANADSFNEIFICDMIMNTGYNVVVCGKLLNDLSVTFVSPIVRHLYNFTQPL